MSYTPEQIQAMRLEFIAEMKETLINMQEAYNAGINTLVRENHVVHNRGVYMQYEFDGLKVTGVKAVSITRATKLSRENAVHLAKTTKNGAGEVAEARSFMECLVSEMANIEQSIKVLQDQYDKHA